MPSSGASWQQKRNTSVRTQTVTLVTVQGVLSLPPCIQVQHCTPEKSFTALPGTQIIMKTEVPEIF